MATDPKTTRFSDWWSRYQQLRQARRVEKAELRLADAEHRLRLWGRHHGTRPSEQRRMEREVESAKEWLEEVCRRG
jgi:hypothetical protein